MRIMYCDWCKQRMFDNDTYKIGESSFVEVVATSRPLRDELGEQTKHYHPKCWDKISTGEQND